jgi:hypothetical protein
MVSSRCALLLAETALRIFLTLCRQFNIWRIYDKRFKLLIFWSPSLNGLADILGFFFSKSQSGLISPPIDLRLPLCWKFSFMRRGVVLSPNFSVFVIAARTWSLFYSALKPLSCHPSYQKNRLLGLWSWCCCVLVLCSCAEDVLFRSYSMKRKLKR